MTALGGWQLPLYYTGIAQEHAAVREQAGCFDLSHMGHLKASGPGAAAWLDKMLTNDTTALSAGQGQFTFLCRDDGSVMDDLMLYKLKADAFVLVINAASIENDLAWLLQHLPAEGVTLDNQTGAIAALGLHGPEAAKQLKAACPKIAPPKAHEISQTRFEATPMWLVRTAQTGEEGFECFLDAMSLPRLWEALLNAGAVPCGLGARDTLRLEAGLPLYGSDVPYEMSPLQAGLGDYVKLDKEDFIGQAALKEQAKAGVEEVLAAFKVCIKSPPPEPHLPLHLGCKAVGHVTSCAVSPTLSTVVGFARLQRTAAVPGTVLRLNIRGQDYDCEVTERPFYRRNTTPTDTP
jgi:aminomethyltransferase